MDGGRGLRRRSEYARVGVVRTTVDVGFSGDRGRFVCVCVCVYVCVWTSGVDEWSG